MNDKMINVDKYIEKIIHNATDVYRMTIEDLYVLYTY